MHGVLARELAVYSVQLAAVLVVPSGGTAPEVAATHNLRRQVLHALPLCPALSAALVCSCRRCIICYPPVYVQAFQMPTLPRDPYDKVPVQMRNYSGERPNQTA